MRGSPSELGLISMGKIIRSVGQGLLAAGNLLTGVYFVGVYVKGTDALRKALNPRGDTRWYIKISRVWVARRDLVAHLTLFAQRFGNVGRGTELLFPQDRKAEAALELGPKRDGYRLAGHAMSAEDAASFQKRLADEIAQARPKPLDAFADQAYRCYATRFREIGATSLFVVPPLIFQSPVSFRQSPPGPLLSFNDATSYPMLFDTKVRIDDAHLTREGAEEFTRLLAREFIRSAQVLPKP